MDKFEQKYKEKDILRSKSNFIYLRFNKYDKKSDFMNKFSLLYSSFNSMKKEGSAIYGQRYQEFWYSAELSKIENWNIGNNQKLSTTSNILIDYS